jgi:hypothetical protein
MTELADELAELLARFRAELAYSDAKGATAYREGMHDGLHFAADALGDVLERHGIAMVAASPAPIPREYGVEP